MKLLLLLLFSFLSSIDACIPTSPAAIPPPPFQSCPMLTEERFDPTVVTSFNANGCVVRTYTCTVSPPPRTSRGNTSCC
ncbi:hypothetical protein PRIPAC_95481 [Pristionchus pacificus]|uniref:Uncharacterized protein n=1 Tax=Pristionchus pacificus TaxID=54126 RepID=A0A2A6D2F1_PRIPA|nr:hypothetical protein PRIPAC_95481 [Pristionchus pacificus]|eukprot:PDM84652.1 hypothetical protein PRIPAC_33675 [Pristionchus pacificus]